MEVLDLVAGLGQERSEILGHPFGQGGDERSLAAGDHHVESSAQVIDLVLGGQHDDLRVDQTGGADHLFDDLVGVLNLEGTRRRRDEDNLGHQPHELIEVQRTIVECTRQAKTVLHEGLLARAVPGVLPAHLGHGDVGLVDHDQEVRRKVVEQRKGALPPAAAVEVRGVVLDPRAHAGLFEHLEVVFGARAQPLSFEELALRLEERQLFAEFDLD